MVSGQSEGNCVMGEPTDVIAWWMAFSEKQTFNQNKVTDRDGPCFVFVVVV